MKARLYDELKEKAAKNAADPSLGPIAREFWDKIKNEIQALESNAAATRYAALGIYDSGEPVVPGHYTQCFLDCTADFAFIKTIKGSPNELAYGLKAYPYGTADYDIFSANDPLAWHILYGNGWLDWEKRYEGMDGPLRWALKSGQIRNPEVWDFLYALFPDEKISDMFWRAPTIQAVKWLDQDPHRADRYYNGLAVPMRDAVASRRYRDTPEIMAYLYSDKEDALSN